MQQVVCNTEGLGMNGWNCSKCHCHRKLSATSDAGWQNEFLRHIFIEELPCLYSAQTVILDSATISIHDREVLIIKAIFYMLLLQEYIMMHGPLNVK